MPLPWTKQETATALRLYSAGHTFTDIAQTLKRSRGEIAGKLFRLRRAGLVVGRVAKEPPPAPRKRPREMAKPSKPRRHPVDYSPASPPRYVEPPKPEGPPTCWELSYNQCRFPIGRRGEDGPTTFCAQETEPGASWCHEHEAVVFTKSRELLTKKVA